MSKRRRLAAGAVAAVIALTMSACGSGSEGSGAAGGLPATVHILSIKELTGAVAFAGTSAEKGLQLAVEEVNEQKFLGSTTLQVDTEDSGYSAQTAASLASQGFANKKYSVISGPLSSQQAAAVAPLAQKAKTPTVFVQAASDGILVGDYIYRVTAPQASFYAANVGPYMQKKDIKSVSVLYNAGSPTIAELATKTIPDMAAEYGFAIKATSSVQLSTQDFASPISKLAATKPDAAVLLLVGAQNPAAMTQLRQAGFTGEVFGNQSSGGNNLKSAGKDGVGVVWATDFNPEQDNPGSQKFVTAYKKKYGEEPLDYAAEAYDSVWLIARALKEAGSADRQDLQKGLDKVAQAGFEGAEGTLSFTDRDLRLPGVLVQWDGSKEVMLSEAGQP
jgi:branched-chain amino acid transport system substrate-binding protein